MKQTPIEIGNALKSKRLSLKITLEDASKDVRIMKKYLEALEDDEFSKLPSEVVIRGFLKNYCSYLGLDPKPLVDEYIRRIKKNTPHIESQTKQITKKENHFYKTIKIASIIAAALFLLLLLAILLNIKGNFPDNKKNIIYKNRVEAIDKDSKNSFKIEVEILEPTWLLVYSDNKIAYSGMVYPYKRKIISARDSIWMKIGNAKGIRVSSNGKILLAPGAAGQIIKKEFLK